MNRRGFFAALVAGAVLDPERLLWRPGAKLISIPRCDPPPPPFLFDPDAPFAFVVLVLSREEFERRYPGRPLLISNHAGAPGGFRLRLPA